MILRKSYLQQRAERSSGVTRDPRRGSPFGALSRLVLTGTTRGDEPDAPGELDAVELPDLLTPQPGPGPDPERLLDQLDLAFLGRASAGELDAELDAMPVSPSSWVAAHFADDLFLSELVNGVFVFEVRGRRRRMHSRFMKRVLAAPATDLETLHHRQEILRELDERQALAAATERLFGSIYHLLWLLRASRDDARLEPIRFRLEVLQAFRAVVEQMAEPFGDAASGLFRLHQVGEGIRGSEAFQRMEALLDHHNSMATLGLQVVVGADGKLRHVEIDGLRERRKNPFYRGPLRRWMGRLRLLFYWYRIDTEEMLDRLVLAVYQEIAPALARVVQLLCHLEVYLAARVFAAAARSSGLEVCLPRVEPGASLSFDGLFNPLLMAMMERPVPCDFAIDHASPIFLVTGPNSGGKTRLLQAVGIAQVLAQAGLYVPCAAARLPLVPGLFASIIELDRADQSEGRLGTELVRLRTLFETVPQGSLVLLDELCSGTNPTEAVEIVQMVLNLLRRLQPVAFVTTHFLEFARQLSAQPEANGFAFLQVEVDGKRGVTYRFIPGVASTSLAVGTAQRLGVTFDELEQKLRQRLAGPGNRVSSSAERE